MPTFSNDQKERPFELFKKTLKKTVEENRTSTRLTAQVFHAEDFVDDRTNYNKPFETGPDAPMQPVVLRSKRYLNKETQ